MSLGMYRTKPWEERGGYYEPFTKENVLAYINRQMGLANRAEIDHAFNVSEKVALKLLKEMEAEGLVRKVGSGRWTQWEAV